MCSVESFPAKARLDPAFELAARGIPKWHTRSGSLCNSGTSRFARSFVESSLPAGTCARRSRNVNVYTTSLLTLLGAIPRPYMSASDVPSLVRRSAATADTPVPGLVERNVANAPTFFQRLVFHAAICLRYRAQKLALDLIFNVPILSALTCFLADITKTYVVRPKTNLYHAMRLVDIF